MRVLSRLIQQMHPFPFWVMIGFLYAGIVGFTLCCFVTWHQGLTLDVYERLFFGSVLFELSSSFIAIGGITAPLMDLIIRHDIGNNK